MYIKEEEHYTFSMFPKEENEVWMFEIYVDKTIEGSRSFNFRFSWKVVETFKLIKPEYKSRKEEMMILFIKFPLSNISLREW